MPSFVLSLAAEGRNNLISESMPLVARRGRYGCSWTQLVMTPSPRMAWTISPVLLSQKITAPSSDPLITNSDFLPKNPACLSFDFFSKKKKRKKVRENKTKTKNNQGQGKRHLPESSCSRVRHKPEQYHGQRQRPQRRGLPGILLD